MKNNIISVIYLILTVFGLLTLINHFLVPLLHPLIDPDFIFKHGVLIFLLEFLSISSSILLFTWVNKPIKHIKPFIGILLFYIVFLAILGFMFGSIFPILFFIISLATKTFACKSMRNEERGYAILNSGFLVIFFIFSVFFVIIFASFFESIFPFSDSVFENKMPDTEGLFVEIPQTMLIWGIMYYSFALILSIVFFVRKFYMDLFSKKKHKGLKNKS